MVLQGNASATVEDCSFNRNMAKFDHGGAIYLTKDSRAKIKACIFDSNSCGYEIGSNICCSKKANLEELKDNQFVGYINIDDLRNIHFENST